MKTMILGAALAGIAAPLPALAATAPAPVVTFEPTRFSVEVMGQGPDVILIPGLSSTRSVWSDTAAHLKARHRVHLVQVKGFGEPAGPNAEGPVLKPFVDDLAAYIRARQLRHPAIVGHSMGGLAALMLAVDAPDLPGKLLIVDALPFIGPIFGADDLAAIRPRADQMRAMLLAQATSVTPDFATAADCPSSLPVPATPVGNMSNSGQGLCLLRHGAKASDLRVVGQAMHDDMLTDLRPRLGEVKVPVTMLYPQDDRLFSAADADALYGHQYAALKGVDLRRIGGSYHFIMQDQPAQFRKALDEWLAR